MAKPAAAPKPHAFDKLDPHLALALGALKHGPQHRDAVEPGPHTVDAIVHLKVSYNVAEDGEAKQVNKIEPWTIITLLLDKLPGVKIEDIVLQADALLQQKEKEANASAAAAEERAQTALDLAKEKAQDAVQAIKDGTKQKRKGAVTIKDVEVKLISQKVA